MAAEPAPGSTCRLVPVVSAVLPAGIASAPGYRPGVGRQRGTGPARRSPASSAGGKRTTYVVEKLITARDEAATACAAVLEVLGPTLRSAVIDAYSDYNDQMPLDVVEAARWLRQRGLDRHAGDPGMSVELQVSDDGWEVLCRYAPWSIHVELFGDGPSSVGTLHDCGYIITADLNSAEATALASRLAGISALVPLHELQEQKQQARRDEVWRVLRRRRPGP